MNNILDIHTHHAVPQPEGIVCVSPEVFSPVDNQLYSVGIHPWHIADATDEIWEKLEIALENPQVVALGECGIDIPKGGPLFRQMQVFKRHIDLSEKIGKPLIIHSVKGQEIIIGLKKEFNPVQPWLIHGFRGKPTIAKMYLDAGIYLSFGELFNPDSLKSLPSEFIFAETDESTLTIEEIIARMSMARDTDMTETIATNTTRFLNLE
ncbi:MAG: hypothetical protein HDR88_13130 [Bacteroides sp.]|nr:hypothetical protein [Bacteroides sp.]